MTDTPTPEDALDELTAHSDSDRQSEAYKRQSAALNAPTPDAPLGEYPAAEVEAARGLAKEAAMYAVTYGRGRWTDDEVDALFATLRANDAAKDAEIERLGKALTELAWCVLYAEGKGIEFTVTDATRDFLAQAGEE